MALSSVLVDNACGLLIALVSQLSLTAAAGHVRLSRSVSHITGLVSV